jgi:triacylglycerol esterase/lipase EstA (alpha/beta hydrolase family)
VKDTVRALGAALVAALLVAGCSSGHHSSGGFSPSTTSAPATTASPSSGPTATPIYGQRACWPIVLVHGFSGFRNLGPVEYWYHIPETLRAQGFDVYVVQDSAWNTVAVRAQELHDQILAQFPDPNVKVNLIGHSMGGLDCRYVVSQLGLASKVASVTTIGTPHHGSPVADVILGLIPGPVAAMTNVVFNFLGFDMKGGANDLTTTYCDGTFNPSTPDAPGVAYFSWAGRADPTGQTGCVLEPWLDSSWQEISNLEGDNDGLVSVTSAQWGDFRGILAADHLNEVGQPTGATGSFDSESFFLDWANELEARGFGP